LAESAIRVNHHYIVGRVRIDPMSISGEGGPHDPRLVLQVSIELNSPFSNHTLALLDLGVSLFTESQNPAKQIGPRVQVDLVNGLPARSFPGGTASHSVPIRVPLTAASIHHIEAMRHATGSDMALWIVLDGRLAWVQHTYGERLPGDTSDDDPFQCQLGTHSTFSYFHRVDFDPLLLQIPQSQWVGQVLPGLGVDNLRLVELAFPSNLGGVGNVAKIFDDARAAYQGRRYEDCIRDCRGIIEAWNKHFCARTGNRLAQIVGDARKWGSNDSDDPRRQFLDCIWKAAYDMTSWSHHPGERTANYEMDGRDAQLVWQLVAILSEYLQDG
jgi:hypothetical protein